MHSPIYGEEDSKTYTIEYDHDLGGRGYYDCPECEGQWLRVTEVFQRKLNFKTAKPGFYRELLSQYCLACGDCGTEQDWHVDDQVHLYFPRGAPEQFCPSEPNEERLVSAEDLLADPRMSEHRVFGPLLRALGDALVSLRYLWYPQHAQPDREISFLLLADISE